MKCAICRHGTTTDGYTTIVLERDQTTVVFKKVPAQICDNCGEEYISAAVNTALLRQAEEEWERGILLEMLNFAA
jgi:YgiT-type zinc finger domain-containing protein